jgi:alkylated DNA repair dioxygenase AlkB
MIEDKGQVKQEQPRQGNLFDETEENTKHGEAESPTPIQGLSYVEDFLTESDHDQMLAVIDAQPWLSELKRRVQHYGYKYDYKSRFVDVTMRLGDLPLWAAAVGRRLLEAGHVSEMPDQVIVNEYLPGQGIASHVDCIPCFTGTIAAVTLGSACVMDFTHKSSRQRIPVPLRPRSLILMTGEARYDWLHGIAARQSDVVGGRRLPRGRRVSVTFRKVIVQQ